MSSYLNEAWTVFQSPILQDARSGRNTSEHPTFVGLESFFYALKNNIPTLNSKKLLVPQMLVHSFPPFRHFGTPSSYEALFNVLLELRANNLALDFIHLAKTLSPSQNLQALLFLYHEYLLFKKHNPTFIDPWDLLIHVEKASTACPAIRFIHFPQLTFFIKQMIEVFSKTTGFEHQATGPKVKKIKSRSLSHFSKILSRATKSGFTGQFVQTPDVWPQSASLNLIQPAFDTPPSIYNDIYGFLSDSLTENVPTPMGLKSIMEDHVVPEALANDPFWVGHTKIPRVIEGIEGETLLWMRYLTQKKQIKVGPKTMMLTTFPHWMPKTKELIFIKEAPPHLTLSPYAIYPTYRSETLIQLGSEHASF